MWPSDGASRLGMYKLVLIAATISSLLSYPRLYGWMVNDIYSGAGDFIIFYTGARIVKAGMGAQLYDYTTQMTFQTMLDHPNVFRTEPLLFNHLPFELLV